MLRLGVIQTRLLYIMHHVCICLWHVKKHINSITNLKSPWDQPCRPPRLLLRHWPPAASTANCGGTGAVAKLPCETVNTAGSSGGWRWRPEISWLQWHRIALHSMSRKIIYRAAYGYWPIYPGKGPRLLPRQFQWVPLVLVVHQWLPHP